MKKFLLTVIAVMAFGASAHAQVAGNTDSDTATATAKVVTPITITATENMSFGTFTINGPTGNVVASTVGSSLTGMMNPDGSPAGNFANTNVTQMGTAKHALFDVRGEPNSAFDIVLDEHVTLTGPGTPMQADLYMTAIQGHLNASGGVGQVFSVFGNLPVTGTQTPGSYSGTFNALVSYQ